MADEFNNPNNGNNQNYAQSVNNDMQVQMAVDNAMAEQKKKKKKKRLIIFGVIAAIIVVIIIAASGGSSSDDKNKVESVNGASQTQSVNGKSDDSKSNDGKSDDSTASDNQKITAGHAITVDNDLKISYLKCDTNFKKYNEYSAPSKGNKVVSATFKIENVSDTDQYISTIDCYADDKKCDSFYGVEDYDDPFFNSISPGRSVEGTVYFEVPSNAKNVELEFENSVWTSDKIVFVIK